MQNEQLVFVYGTLKSGHGNHALLRNARFLGKAFTVKSGYQMYSLGMFPGVVTGSNKIYGEVYSVDPDTMANLDHLEGHPHFYSREKILVEVYKNTGSGNINEAWMYLYNGDTVDCQPLEEWV